MFPATSKVSSGCGPEGGLADVSHLPQAAPAVLRKAPWEEPWQTPAPPPPPPRKV